MAVIDSNHATLEEDQKKFWEDALKNARILYFELDKAIYSLVQEERKSFTIDTGQTTLNVSRQDVPALIDRREKLQKQIEELEEKLGITGIEEKPKLIQAVPKW